MIKGELNIKCATCEEKICHDGYNFCNEAMKENSFYKNKRLYKGIKPNKKLSYAELEEKISILLSCKNCPENKGGLICQKEYEDKCLAQKIQYIKELKEENTELNDKLNNLASVAEVRLANWQKYEQENAELRAKIEKMKLCQNCKFEDNDCIEEPCSACTRCLGNLKRKGNSDKWELQEG